MRGSKWILGLVIILGFAISLLGCSNQSTPSTSTSSKNNAQVVENKFPEKDINLLVPWDAGSTSDRNARAIQSYFVKQIGKNLIINNVPGASGLAGWNAYMAKPTEGYDFTFTNWPVLYNPVILGTAKYKLDDFYNLGGINKDPIIILKRKNDNRWNNFADFIEDAKKNPGKYKLSMTGPNSFQNLVSYYLMDVFDIKFQIVNSPGGANEANQMLAGEFVDLTLTNSYSGYLIRDVADALGLLSNIKVPNMWPEATPISEQTGKKDLADLNVMRGFSINSEVQKKYPDRVKILQDALAKAATDPEFIEAMKKSGEEDVAYWIPKGQFDPLIKDVIDITEKYKQYLTK